MSNGIGVINVKYRSAAAGIVKTGAKGAGGQTWIVNGIEPELGRDVVGGECILRGAVGSIESVHLESITGTNWDQNRVRGGNQRSARMGESGVQINRRRPMDGIQILGRGLIDGGMLRVASKGVDASRADQEP